MKDLTTLVNDHQEATAAVLEAQSHKHALENDIKSTLLNEHRADLLSINWKGLHRFINRQSFGSKASVF